MPFQVLGDEQPAYWDTLLVQRRTQARMPTSHRRPKAVDTVREQRLGSFAGGGGSPTVPDAAYWLLAAPQPTLSAWHGQPRSRCDTGQRSFQRRVLARHRRHTLST